MTDCTRRSLLIAACLLASTTQTAPLLAQAEKASPELKAMFHQDFRGDPKNPNVRPIREGNFRWEAEGARITMPAGQGKLATAGVAGNFHIKGDFEITASYEILKAEKPSEGYGVGVSFFVAIDSGAMDAVSLARRVGLKGNSEFLSDRMKPGGANVEHTMRSLPARSAFGRLQITRRGTVARFLVADGDKAEFVPIVQDPASKSADIEFGTGEIRYFQIGGDAGDSEAALDMRVLDLTVRAEELPGLSQTAPSKVEEPAWMQKARSGQPASSAWSGLPIWAVAVAGGGVAALLAVVGLGVFVVVRRRARAPAANVKKPRPAAEAGDSDGKPMPSIALKCQGCGKVLRLKPAAAGKKVKCPNCATVSQVPGHAVREKGA
jgi:hypothetical protein